MAISSILDDLWIYLESAGTCKNCYNHPSDGQLLLLSIVEIFVAEPKPRGAKKWAKEIRESIRVNKEANNSSQGLVDAIIQTNSGYAFDSGATGPDDFYGPRGA